ncbi:MAG: hypothetical protein NZ580_07500, partial [Bacteroidia bacterium]|nr:hypothetical protein [Bacteroidia bacterium]
TDNYNNEENGVLTLTAPAGQSIRVRFTSFNAEANYDSLYIYDGPTTSSPLIGGYSGTALPPPIITQGNSITFRFKSDLIANRSGWAAEVSCVVPPPPCHYFMGNGVTVDLSSPNCCGGASFFDSGGADGSYSNNAGDTMTFRAPAGQRIQFRLRELSLLPGDTLILYDGPVPNPSLFPIVARLSGTDPDFSFISSGRSLTLVFRSDASGVSSGWRAELRCVSPSCIYSMSAPNVIADLTTGNCCATGAVFYDSGGLIGNYQNNEDRVITFVASTGQRIKVDFSSFSVEQCCDTLYAYDGSSTNSPLIGVYQGNLPPFSVISSENSLTFRLVSDGSGTAAGWSANVSCFTGAVCRFLMRNDTSYSLSSVGCCDGALFLDSGGETGNYSNRENRIHTFSAPPGQRIEATFLEFATEACCDYLFVYDGGNTQAPLIGRFSGSTFPTRLLSSDSLITFRFVSDGAATAAGWRIRLRCTANPCEYAMTAPNQSVHLDSAQCCGEANFYDSGGAGGTYTNNENRTFTFRTLPGKRIRVSFSVFDIAGGDALRIYDGESTSAPLLGSFSGTTAPPDTLSTGSALTFQFISDAAGTGQGWYARLSCVSTCDYRLSNLPQQVLLRAQECCGKARFTDNGGPTASYANNLNQRITFIAPAGQKVRARFRSFQVDSTDVLRVYDGSDLTGRLLGSFTGSSLPPVLLSSGSTMTFVFLSDAARQAEGWLAEVSYALIDTAVIARDTLLMAARPDTSSASYSWVRCSQPSQVVATGPVFVPRDRERYALVVRDLLTGCSDTSACYVVPRVTALSVALEGVQLLLYPNPSGRETVWLESSEPMERVRIWNLQGALLYEEFLRREKTTLPMLPAGVYSVEVLLRDGRSTNLRWIVLE